MQNTFDNKFKSILKSKRNRTAVYDFIDKIVQENPIDTKSDLFYFYMYEIYTEYMIIPKLEDFFQSIKNKQFGYHHSTFDTIKKCLEEEQNFIENPPVVEEGVIECGKCKSKRTFSFNKQTRSGDEAVTVFVRCADCGHQFRM
jgi:DNA-directed RNA polymerase subunit M/transcription elongation factor TFIIS